MARTFVSVELRDRRARTRFANAMDALGFSQTLKGAKKGKALRLPTGTFLLERASPTEALELARQAVRNANVQAHILCVPAGANVRFANLSPDA